MISISRPIIFAGPSFYPIHHFSMGQLGQEKLPSSFPSPEGKTRNELLLEAGDIMIITGEEVSKQVSAVYEEYKGIGRYGLLEAAASAIFTPVALTADIWWQSSRAEKAILSLRAALKTSNEYRDQMLQKWMPEFYQDIWEIDEAKARKIQQIMIDLANLNIDIIGLTYDAETLPTSLLVDAAKTIFKESWQFLSLMFEMLTRILQAIKQLSELVAKGAIEWPMVAVVGGLLIAGYFALK